MADVITGSPNNSHTSRQVPFHLVDDSTQGVKLRYDGALQDIAPTVLRLLELKSRTK
ncbi:MAG: hypothetical protein IPJ30_15125 [Acidobacteria bacterium]|nr:hypothetical protein [Acidobacteriota bacterium]